MLPWQYTGVVAARGLYASAPGVSLTRHPSNTPPPRSLTDTPREPARSATAAGPAKKAGDQPGAASSRSGGTNDADTCELTSGTISTMGLAVNVHCESARTKF